MNGIIWMNSSGAPGGFRRMMEKRPGAVAAWAKREARWISFEGSPITPRIADQPACG
jgi:hypothetical protein